MINTGEAVSSNRVITEKFVSERLGFVLARVFSDFETDANGVISFGEEMERLSELAGYKNVLGSLYFEGDELQLGIFIRQPKFRRSED